MDDDKGLSGLAGGELAVGTVLLAIAGGPLWAVGVFGGIAGFALKHAFTGDESSEKKD